MDTTPSTTVPVDSARRPIQSMISGTSPARFVVCSDAFRPDSVDRVYILGPDEELVTIDGWGSHPGWKDTVSQAVAIDLRNLRQLIGVPLTMQELRIQEVARSMPTYAMDYYRPGGALLYLDEDVDEPGVVTTAFARFWFNHATIAEPWLEQGLARWSGLAAIGRTCPEVQAAPVDPPPDMAIWSDPATSLSLVDREVLRWRSDVACDIVTRVADLIGAEAMTQVTTELLTAAEPAGWQAWLASVEQHLEELPEVEATLARDLLLDYGVVTSDELAEVAAQSA